MNLIDQPTLVIVRGPACSGKSTLVQEIVIDHPNAVICSTDSFFHQKGTYVFDNSRLKEYHQLNLKRCLDAMDARTPFIVIDNTNILPWEMCPYVCASIEKKYALKLISMPALSLQMLLDRNLERKNIGKFIPPEVIKHHVETYDELIGVDELKQWCLSNQS